MARGRRILLLLSVVLGLALAGTAHAAGGHYSIDGGTPRERAQVVAALNASAFPWDVVPQQIAIHIAPNLATSDATPGEIWLDSRLLDAGRFSWGVVQHEYAHQVDFLLFSDDSRQMLLSMLGGQDWCNPLVGLRHDQYGCERFASTLAWAYWPSPANSMKPQSRNDESAAMPPAAFRALMSRLLGVPDPLAQTRGLTSLRK